MKRLPIWIACLILSGFLAACATTLPSEPPTDPALAQSPAVFQEPEAVFIAAGSGIVFVPDMPYDVFFFEGRWFWKLRDTWYWSRSYMGTLYLLKTRQVPRKLRAFQMTYRDELADFSEVPFKEWKATLPALR